MTSPHTVRLAAKHITASPHAGLRIHRWKRWSRYAQVTFLTVGFRSPVFDTLGCPQGLPKKENRVQAVRLGVRHRAQTDAVGWVQVRHAQSAGRLGRQGLLRGIRIRIQTEFQGRACTQRLLDGPQVREVVTAARRGAGVSGGTAFHNSRPNATWTVRPPCGPRTAREAS